MAKRKAWTKEEDERLIAAIEEAHGPGSWTHVPKAASICRSYRSCRNRWLNYLRPGINRDEFSVEEEEQIIKLHAKFGEKWGDISKIMGSGRTENHLRNHYWRKIKPKLISQGINPWSNQPIKRTIFGIPQEPIYIVYDQVVTSDMSCGDYMFWKPREVTNEAVKLNQLDLDLTLGPPGV